MNRTLPEILERYKTGAFWDTPLSAIDGKIHRDFIIERLLQYGGMEGIHWLLDNWGPDAVRDVVMRTRRS